MKWEIVRKQFDVDREAIEDLLKNSWEPFAVDDGFVYLRRRKSELKYRGRNIV